jgi:hypothetical protein
LVCVVSSEEQARKIIAKWPPGDGDTSRLGSRELMNDEIKCSLHGEEEQEEFVYKEPVQ